MSPLHRLTPLLAAALATHVTCGPASAQSTALLRYAWSCPITGSPAAYYVVEHSVDGGPFQQVGRTTTATYILEAAAGREHRIRVAAVDHLGREGPFSEASTGFTPDPDSPWKPGKPSVTIGPPRSI